MTFALAAAFFLAFSVLSVAIATVEAAFHMVRRRRVTLPGSPEDVLARYQEDPPTLLMPAHMGTYLAHVGMTIAVTSVLVDRLAHWALVVAFLVMVIYLLTFRLTLPYALARRDPERALAVLLPVFHVYAQALAPLVELLRRRAEPEGEPPTEIPDRRDRTEVPPPPVRETDEGRLVDAVTRFTTRLVRDVMTPRPDMVAMAAGGTVEELRRLMSESRYSRIPIFGDNLDDIVGVVTVRDVIAFQGAAEDPLRPLAREVLLIPETKKVADLLREFQFRHTTFAVVIDEYGGTAGLVTVEDIVEEIVGEIADEFDVESDPLSVEADGAVLVSGRVHVERLEEALGAALSEGGVDTVGGLVASVFGRIPRAGDRAEHRGFTVEVVDAERKRVNRVRFRRLPPAEAE